MVLDSGVPVAALALPPAAAQPASDPLAAMAMHKKDNVLIIIGSPLGAQGTDHSAIERSLHGTLFFAQNVRLAINRKLRY
jgi:hypothetical protein